LKSVWHHCYLLTAADHASRFLLLCEALDSTREETALTAFERLFRERGLPLAIRSDNGIWLVSFIHCDLGYFDLEQKTRNPSTTRSRLSAMS
jgi:transposase InsO family protein